MQVSLDKVSFGWYMMRRVCESKQRLFYDAIKSNSPTNYQGEACKIGWLAGWLVGWLVVGMTDRGKRTLGIVVRSVRES
jgi:hypothetical protein